MLFTVVSQESLHLVSSCQAVGFALKTPILPCTFPLEHLQDPEEHRQQYSTSQPTVFTVTATYCKCVVVSFTEVPSERLVHWVQPVETNRVPSPLQQLRKAKFPKKQTRLDTLSANPQKKQSGYALTSVFISLAIIFMNSLSPSFLQKEKEALCEIHRYTATVKAAPLLYMNNRAGYYCHKPAFHIKSFLLVEAEKVGSLGAILEVLGD